MIDRCYLEITDVCNLQCVFCPKTKRAPKTMSQQEFDTLTDRLKGQVRFLYFHLMGEPLLHPCLPQFIGIARAKGFIPVITTNGTLIGRMPLTGIYKVNISLHSFEGNGRIDPEKYISDILSFACKSDAITVLRLWNRGGHDSMNDNLINLIAKVYNLPWTEVKNGYKLAERVFIEYDDMFEWPDHDAPEDFGEELFCYGLRGQIGVLVDGTVVPCCLDHDGDMALGNLHEQPLETILKSDRARRIYDGFTSHKAVEPLCRRCGYAAKTKQYRK